MTKLEIQKNNALINKGMRAKTRSVVLNLLKENINSDKPYSQAYTAKMAGCSVGTVNAIKQKLDNNIDLSISDLQEQTRGRKPNNFNVINERAYDMLYCAVHNFKPHEFGIDESSWTLRAIRIF